MYNALALIALLPLAGPDAGEHLAAVPPAVKIFADRPDADPGERIPVLPSAPIRTRVAYTPDSAAPRLPASPVVSPVPATPMSSQHPAPSTPPPTFEQPPRDPNIVQTRGILEVPKWNNISLSAPNSANQSVLMALRTEQRDAAGNVLLGADGNPLIVPLREGMHVFKDQVLGNFDDRELHNQLRIAEAELKVAIAAENKRIEIEYAATGVQTAMTSLQILKATNQMHEGAITRLEILKSELELEQAKANLALQKYNIENELTEKTNVQREQVEAMRVRIELRKLIAPISGVIVKIEKAEGEWLREGDPVLEIMNLETLRARCKVSARYYTPSMIDDKPVSVSMPMADGRTEEFPGKVVFADPKVSAGDEFEVFIEVQNRPVGRSWLLQPGRTVTAAIRL